MARMITSIIPPQSPIKLLINVAVSGHVGQCPRPGLLDPTDVSMYLHDTNNGINGPNVGELHFVLFALSRKVSNGPESLFLECGIAGVRHHGYDHCTVHDRLLEW
jgi:hypothetical protein